MVKHIRLRGTYYEVGKELGKSEKASIEAILEHLRQSDLYRKIQDYTQTQEGGAVYTQLGDTCTQHCAEYVDELRGIADGADVDYNDLFILNVCPDLAAALGIVPDGSHGVKYAAIFAGCTNLLLQTDNKKVILVHTEDFDPFYTDKALLLSAEILGSDGELKEKWTEYTVPGELPGSKFGFNSNGIMYGHNNIYQKGLNKHGIPRRFMCRRLISIRKLSEAKAILSKSPGMASAYSFTFVRSDINNSSDHAAVSQLETVGTDNGANVVEIQPTSLYHHCNILQHISHECHPEESSIHREAVISQYACRGELRTKEDLLKVVSDDRDPVFPVYRSGEYPDYLQTGATGAFDTYAGTMEVYTDKPSSNPPQHVLRIDE